MPQAKATKKFEKNKLKDVIKRRKENAKVKQKQQMSAKRKERRAKDNARTEDQDEENVSQVNTKSGQDTSMGEMSMDQFFAGGFQVPELTKKSATKTKKRKRTPMENDSGSGSEGEGAAEPQSALERASSESESGDDAAGHKEQLAKLAEKDPEFYKYLKDNDAELLDFEDADMAEIDALSESEGEDEGEGDAGTPRKKRKSGKAADAGDEVEGGSEVMRGTVAKWKNAMEESRSLRATREVVLAFRSAAHINDDSATKYKYAISDPDAYHDLLIAALELVPQVLQHHLPTKETATGQVRLSTDSKKFRSLSPLLKSHAVSVQYLLENLSDASTLRKTLESLLSLLPYILSFKKVVRDVSKTVAAVWADHANTEVTRLSAFLVLRRMVVIGDPTIKEAVLKEVYQGLVKGARNTTVHNIQGINLMKNTASELWGLDANLGYTTGFAFIRQLAIHLRSSITNKTKDSYKTVYNWQYVHSLDFWSRVVAAHCESLREAESGKPSPLRPLIYPIVQVTLGAMRLIPTAPYFPLRFQLVRSLLRISSATSTYIPLAPALVEVLSSAEMKKPPKPSTLKALDFSTTIRATKAYLRTRMYQDGIGEQVVELLSEFFVLWAKNIAFPELSLPVIVVLKRWLKAMAKKVGGNRNTKVNSQIAVLVQKLESNARFVEGKRAKVEFAPNDRAGVEGFLKETEWEKTPVGAYVVGQRREREKRAKLLEEARKVEDKKRKEKQQAEADGRAESFGTGSEDEEDGMDVDESGDNDE